MAMLKLGMQVMPIVEAVGYDVSHSILDVDPELS